MVKTLVITRSKASFKGVNVSRLRTGVAWLSLLKSNAGTPFLSGLEILQR